MKKAWKLILTDIFIVLLNIIFFSNISFNSFISFVLMAIILIASVFTHCFSYIRFFKNYVNIDEKMNSIIQNEDDKFETYMASLEEIQKTNPNFKAIIGKFVYQIKSFSTKEEALMSLIDLNNGKSENFLMGRNADVQQFLIKNLKKFVKRLIVYNAKNERNRNGSVENDEIINEIFLENRKLIDLYDQLLDEVSRMGDDFNISDPGLQNVIENLQTLRNANEDEPSKNDDEIHLFVSTGSQH